MQHFYTSCLTLILLLTSTNVLAITKSKEGDDAERSRSDRYPDEFVRDYNQECVQTSMTEGLAETEAQQLCDCTLNRFQSKYSLEEFKQITAASVNDKTAETTLVEVGQVCFEEILYGE